MEYCLSRRGLVADVMMHSYQADVAIEGICPNYGMYELWSPINVEHPDSLVEENKSSRILQYGISCFTAPYLLTYDGRL
jgi:hypothetical protein